MKTVASITAVSLVLFCACSDEGGVKAAEPKSIGQTIDGVIERATDAASEIAGAFEKNLEGLDKDLEALRKRVGEQSGSARKQLTDALRDLDAKRLELAKKLEELGTSSGDETERTRKQLEQAFDALDRKVEDLIAEFE